MREQETFNRLRRYQSYIYIKRQPSATWVADSYIVKDVRTKTSHTVKVCSLKKAIATDA